MASFAAALSGSNLINATNIIQYTYSNSSYTSGWTATSTGQSLGSERDQQNTQLSLENLVEAFAIMENQYDLQAFFAKLSKRLMASLEYTTKHLIRNSVAYNKSFYRCHANLLMGHGHLYLPQSYTNQIFMGT